MSVINEALKKAGQPIIRQSDEKKSETYVLQALERHRKKSGAPWRSFFILALLTLIVGPVLAPVIRGSSQKKNLSPAHPAPRTLSMGKEVSPNAVGKPEDSASLAQFSIEETALGPATVSGRDFSAKDSPLPQFSLSGIVYSEPNSYCLINGQVLKKGDKVGGATLENILPNEISLDYLGKKIIIPVSS